MSSGQKSCNDDEDDWYDLQKKAGILDTYWKVYSFEAREAKEGYVKYNLKGDKLIEYVDLNNRIKDLLERNKAELMERETLRILKQKYPDA